MMQELKAFIGEHPYQFIVNVTVVATVIAIFIHDAFNER